LNILHCRVSLSKQLLNVLGVGLEYFLALALALSALALALALVPSPWP